MRRRFVRPFANSSFEDAAGNAVGSQKQRKTRGRNEEEKSSPQHKRWDMAQQESARKGAFRHMQNGGRGWLETEDETKSPTFPWRARHGFVPQWKVHLPQSSPGSPPSASPKPHSPAGSSNRRGPQTLTEQGTESLRRHCRGTLSTNSND